ncbi:MAG TPA: SRPBCC family protein [Cytophagaceae bacterium]|jgi:ligand-binding SRPBCC domain-containing protein|nr:SRPBCC family protein [Cytophagaceae bacterium]
MQTRILERTTIINRPCPEVFDFFSKAENLHKITPPDLSFKIIAGDSIEMKKGTLINYHIKISGISLEWQTLISEWNPPHSFADTQVKGPYAKWVHTHSFHEENNRTTMHDRVEYRSPGWIFEPLLEYLIVRKKLKSIFDYRQKRCEILFNHDFNSIKNHDNPLNPFR